MLFYIIFSVGSNVYCREENCNKRKRSKTFSYCGKDSKTKFRQPKYNKIQESCEFSLRSNFKVCYGIQTKVIMQVAENEKQVTGLMSWLKLEDSKSQPNTNVCLCIFIIYI